MKKTIKTVRCFLCALLFVFSPLLKAQTGQGSNDHFREIKNQYKKIFGGETRNDSFSNKTTNIPLPLIKTHLPQWVVQLPPPSDLEIYTLGISDPGMQKDSAIALATLRAKALLALFMHSDIKGSSDYFISNKNLKTGEITASKYNEYTKIIGKIAFNNTDFKIRRDTFTFYKEAIVLASLHLAKPLSADSSLVACLGNVLGSYTTDKGKHAVLSRTELFSKAYNNNISTASIMDYIVKRVNRQIKIKSIYDRKQLPATSLPVFYQASPGDSLPGEKSVISNTLRYGLWNALSNSIICTLAYESKGDKARVSGLNDHYNQTLRDLTRIITSKTVSMRLTGLEVHNNTLQIHYFFTNKSQRK